MALIIEFRNISGLAPWSDYEYQVRVNDRLIESGTVTGHLRAWGWERLVERFLRDRSVEFASRKPAAPDRHLGASRE